MRFYARTRADVRPDAWNLQFAVIVDDQVIGVCDLSAGDFPSLRQFTTGSWLGRQFQGRGLGKELRMAALTLGFDGFGAEFALTGMWHDNAASKGVTDRSATSSKAVAGRCGAASPTSCWATGWRVRTGRRSGETTSRWSASRPALRVPRDHAR